MITGEFIELACKDKSCAPPPVGTGGSKPSVGGVQSMDRLISNYPPTWVMSLSPKLRIPNKAITSGELRNEVQVASALRLGAQLSGKVDWDEFKGYESLPMSPGDYRRFVGKLRSIDDLPVGAFTRLDDDAYQTAFEEGRVGEFAADFERTIGFPFETVLAAGVSHAWIMGAGVEPTKLMQMQRVAAEILPQNGETAPADIKNFDGTPMPQDATWIPEGAMRTVLKQVYDNTQTDLTERGVDEVTLVRGVRLPGPGPAPVFGVAKEPEVVDVRLRPLSSYATRFESTAGFWAKGTRDKDHPAIIVTRVPRKYVFATPYQGPASWDESEVTVLGGTHRSTVYAFSSTVQPSNIMNWDTEIDPTLDT
jgi:hypothetical protein